MSKEKLLQLQMALFFGDNEERPDRLMTKIDEALENTFDQMPTIIPVPSDAPAEIPRVMAKSSNGIYTCNIAKSRIDLNINYANSPNSITVDLEDFINKVRPFASIVFGMKNIIRFGFVGHYFFQSKDPVKLIQSKYFKNDLGALDEINIRYNKKFYEKDIEINDVISVSAGEVSENGQSMHSGVLIQRDLNNAPVDKLNIEDVISIIIKNQDRFGISGITGLIL